jgi:hypothetical protein
MAEEQQEPIAVKELSSTSFGYVIAFLLPGLLGLYALGLWFPDVQELLKPATSKDATIGPSFILLLCALTVGLLVGAARFYVFQRWICRKHQLQAEVFHNLTGEKLTAFKSAVDEHYRYHQFYGGCSIAVVFLFPRWLWMNWSSFTTCNRAVLVGIFLAFEAFLVVTARDSFTQYTERGNKIVTG